MGNYMSMLASRTESQDPKFLNPSDENLIEKMLPPEIIFQIFSKLNDIDLYNTSLSTTSWNDYSTAILKTTETQKAKTIINFFIKNLDPIFHNEQINQLKKLLDEKTILHETTFSIIELKKIVYSIKKPLLNILDTIDYDFLKTIQEKSNQSLQIHPFFLNIFELLKIRHILKSELKNISKNEEIDKSKCVCKIIACENTFYQIAEKESVRNQVEFIVTCEDPVYLNAFMEYAMEFACYGERFNKVFSLIKIMLHEFCKKLPDTKENVDLFLEKIKECEQPKYY